MKWHTSLFAAALALVVALLAWAGSGEKCTADAQTCLNHLSAKKAMGWLGVELDKSKDESHAMVVKLVVDEGPADQAGVRAGDILVALNGAPMADADAVKKAKGDWKVGQKVTYTIQREGKSKDFVVTLGALPEEVFARMVGQHMVNDHMATAATAVTTEAAAPTK